MSEAPTITITISGDDPHTVLKRRITMFVAATLLLNLASSVATLTLSFVMGSIPFLIASGGVGLAGTLLMYTIYVWGCRRIAALKQSQQEAMAARAKRVLARVGHL